MKRFAFILMAAAALFTACQGEEGGSTGGGKLNIKADFTIAPNPAFTGEEVSFDATASDGIAPYTFNWEIGTEIKLEGQNVKYTFEKNSAYIVKLTVTDKDGNKVEKRKNLIVNPAPVAEKGEVKLLWAANIRGYNTISTPAIADDGSVYAVSGANKDLPGMIYKFDKEGKLLWSKELGARAKGTPSIDADGTVFLGVGSDNGTGKVLAYNPDGSIKWEFTDFWAAPGATASPSFQGAICGIGAKNIYFGNCGTTGSVLAVDKATGARVGYIANEEGTGGPAGGVRAGVVISKGGMIAWGGGQYGVFSASQNTIDGANNSHVTWAARYYPVAVKHNSEGGIAIATIGGKTCVVGTFTSKETVLPIVYAFDINTGEAVCQYAVEETGDMDNGAVVVTKEGYIVATLNFTNGKEDGGIIVIDPSTPEGKLVAEYRVQEKVSCSPAIDAAGNIHFGTESGNYYVVDKSCKLIAKKELAAFVLADDRYKEAIPFDSSAKVYSSPVIGDDGKVYLQFTNNDTNKTRAFGALVCLEVGGCTGVGDTPWPMFGQNRRHTNCEK